MFKTSRPVADAAEVHPWPRALGWLFVLGPFFFISYGFATWVTEQRTTVDSIVFAWERHIPLLPWTIVPYWLIDLLYALSLLVCTTRRQLDTHALRLLATQLLAVSCFLLFPLRCTFERGPVDGAFGTMFNLLMSFDKPFNQAPSLHIALLVVLLETYLRIVPRTWHLMVLATSLLIGLSVLTTWQHHFFDIPTGLCLGCFAVWLFPSGESSPLLRVALTRDPGRWRIAFYYASAALVLGLLAVSSAGAWLWLLWASGSLAMVAIFYLMLDGNSFQKQTDGSMPVAVRLLLAPYLLGAWLNSRWWTRGLSRANAVTPGIFLGRIPTQAELKHCRITAVVDLCAELPCPTPGLSHMTVPLLDLVQPSVEQLEQASLAIEEARQAGPVLVCCALGFARSALAVAAWLMRADVTVSPEEAIAQVQKARPSVVLGKAHIALLRQWQQHYSNRTSAGISR